MESRAALYYLYVIIHSVVVCVNTVVYLCHAQYFGLGCNIYAPTNQERSSRACSRIPWELTGTWSGNADNKQCTARGLIHVKGHDLILYISLWGRSWTCIDLMLTIINTLVFETIHNVLFFYLTTTNTICRHNMSTQFAYLMIHNRWHFADHARPRACNICYYQSQLICTCMITMQPMQLGTCMNGRIN